MKICQLILKKSQHPDHKGGVGSTLTVSLTVKIPTLLKNDTQQQEQQTTTTEDGG